VTWRLTGGPTGQRPGNEAEVAGGLTARVLGRAWAESGVRPVVLVGGPIRYEKGFPITFIPIKLLIQI
jgi:hypothetical protein